MRTDISGGGAQRLTDEVITAFYQKHSLSVYRLCMSYLRDPEDSADAVQETFLRWINCSDRPQGEQHEIGWLVMTAGNICRDMLRHRKRYKRESIESACEIGKEERAFNDRELFDVVCSLPDKYKNVIFLFYYEDMTTAQICEATGMKQSTVTSLLTRARRLLKKALGDDING